MVVEIERMSIPLHEGTGPFSGAADGLMPARIVSYGRSYGIITSESDAKVLKALALLKAASRHQIGEYTGLSQHALKTSMPRLLRLGFIDAIETGRTPPIYMLGPEGLILFKKKPEEWHVLKAFRIAAANQLFLKLRPVLGADVSYEVEPHQGLTASIKAGDTEFGVIAPRVWPGEVDWCRDMVDIAPEEVRLVIVAGSKLLAEECCRVIKSPRPIRFTWDGLLKDGAVFYKKKGNILIPAENFTLTEQSKVI